MRSYSVNITKAKYLKPRAIGDEPSVNSAILATIDSTEMSIPLDPANRHYAEILRQVAAGELTIADAD